MTNTDTQKIKVPISPQAETPEVNFTGFTPGMIYGDTHQGLVRMGNEDSYAYSVSEKGDSILALVADGIGGNECGDLASRFVAEKMLRDFQIRSGGGFETQQMALDYLRSSIILANSALRGLNSNFNIVHPMGCTLASALFLQNVVITGHAGDSRVYCLRDHKLIQYTQDHSLVAEMLQRGEITPEAAKRHPFAHVISKSIGIEQEMDPEFNVFRRAPHDRFLICSDGVMLHLSDSVIRDILDSAKDAREAVSKIISMTLRGGGGDNTTAVCIFTG